VRDIKDIVSDPQASVTGFLGDLPSYEMHIPIIDALAGNRSGVFPVNVRNDGAITGIADDVVVEIPAHIDESGVHPVPFAPLPRKVMLEQTLPCVLRMEHTLEVLRTGDLSMLMWGALMHPQTRSYEQARDVLSDLLVMEGNDRLREHHGWPREGTTLGGRFVGTGKDWTSHHTRSSDSTSVQIRSSWRVFRALAACEMIA